LLYFATLSWLPTMLRDRGATPETAGNLLSLMVLGNLAAALVVPVVAQRLHGQRVLAVATAAGLAAGLAGALYAPLGSAVAWVLILGISQGAALALAIFFTIARAPDPASAASLSSLAQAVGYLVASAGPLELGLLHSATGNWNLPVAVLFAVNGCLFAAGMMAGRPRVLPSRVALADAAGGPSSVQYEGFLYSERTVVPLRSPPDLDARAVSLGTAPGSRIVQSCGGYPADPAPSMVEVFSRKDER
jgi:CP family cyanate transporter-like MFS transporter